MEVKYSLSNAKLSLSFEKKRITSLIINNREYVTGEVPFFAIKIRDKKGEHQIIDAFDFDFVSYKDHVAKYTYQGFEAKLTVKQVSVNGLSWRINVTNNTNLLIEQVELMSVGLPNKLVDEGGEGQILIPYNEGALIPNLKRRMESFFSYEEPDYPSYGKNFVFPNMICSQFIAYLLDDCGLYFGMHDESRTTKHIDFRYCGEALKIQLRTFTNTNYGEDYSSPFDSILQVFNGDAYEACDIYRNWFYKHLPNGLKKIEDNYALPYWYHESPLIVSYPVRGESDRDTKMLPNSGFYPYLNVLDELKNISNKTNSKVMALLMQYESTAPWAPPYVWPPIGGEEMFSEFISTCHQNNILVGLYASGLGWTNKSFRDSNYHKEDEFERDNLKEIMCTNTDGFMKSTVVDDIRFGYDLCPACEKSKSLLVNEANKVFAHHVDYMQLLDQNHGGCSYFCYSDKHGHVPAPGQWQQVETNKLLDSIDRCGALLGAESGASEPMISNLLFSDNRFILNYFIGKPFPLYSYIYHEFVNNFMGNQVSMQLKKTDISYTYRTAYSFICGDMLTVVLNNNYDIVDAWGQSPTVDKDITLKFINTLNDYRRKFIDYLHFGKVVKPIEFDCNDINIEHNYGFFIKEKTLLTSAFANNGNKYQFVVNYTKEPQTIRFNKERTIYLDSDLKQKIKIEEYNIPPLSVICFKI